MIRTSNQLTTGLFRPATGLTPSTTGLTPSTTGLTPSPSPRGEGSNMQCYYNVRDKIIPCSGNA